MVGSWSDWTACDTKCMRGKSRRSRACLDPSIYDATTKMCGSDIIVEEKDCLDRSDCTGSGNYLADPGMSCEAFCETKGM